MRAPVEVVTQLPLTPAPKPRRTADHLVDMLIRAGVDVVFGLPGGAISPVHDALMMRPEVRMVTFRHEGGAAFAAAGYARVTGKLGVVVVTSGPGATNALTGLTSAQLEGVPMLVLAGEAPRDRFGHGALQEGSRYAIDLVSVARSITKLSLEAHDPATAPAMLKRAIATALSGRMGAVFMTLPLDVASAVTDSQPVSGELRLDAQIDPIWIRSVARILERSKKPLIFAGSGARWGEGPQHLRSLAEALQAPVVTSPKAKGVFPSDHPLALGVWGWACHPSAIQYAEKGIDTLLVVGSGLGEIASNGWSPLLRPTRELIQIDIDVSAMGRNYPVTRGLVGYAAEVLPAIKAALKPGLRLAKRFGVRCFTDPESFKHGSEGRIAPQRAIWELQRALPTNTMFASDLGEHMLYAIHYLHTYDPQGFLIMMGFASMGSGIGASIGMKLGQPHRPVAVICGDGCFAMGLAEIAAIGSERLPILIAVIDDERYGMVEIGHEAVYGQKPAYPICMDIVQVAKGLGVDGAMVSRADEMSELDLPARLERGPFLLDIKIDRTVRMPRNPRNDFLSESSRRDS